MTSEVIQKCGTNWSFLCRYVFYNANNYLKRLFMNTRKSLQMAEPCSTTFSSLLFVVLKTQCRNEETLEILSGKVLIYSFSKFSPFYARLLESSDWKFINVQKASNLVENFNPPKFQISTISLRKAKNLHRLLLLLDPTAKTVQNRQQKHG